MATDGIILWQGGEGRAEDGGAGGWLRVVDGRIVQRGAGLDWRAGAGLVALPPGEAAMLIVPAGDVALHWIQCPGMTVRQGAAAAPLLAVEGSIGPAEALHAATAPAPDPEQPHVVAVVARRAMEDWLRWCAAANVEDAAIVPAALLLPPPAQGFIAGKIAGGAVLRGTDCALDGQAPHASLVVGEAPVHLLTDGEVEAGLVGALGAPPLDLRQGLYAPRRQGGIDARWLGRVAVLVGASALCALLVSLVTIARLHGEAATLDARTIAIARPLVPQASDAADADARLSALLAARGGAGGFTGTVAGIATAMRGQAGVHLISLSQLADGSVRMQVAGPNGDALNAALLALQNAGWRIAANGVRQQGAETVADITVVGS